ncbi:MAG: DRTGG domain-containing protein [Spirochaetota bacterium]
MSPKEIAERVQGTFVAGEPCERDVNFAFAADLMSDVLTITQEDVLFITGLVAPQTIRTAVVSDISTILIVRGKPVPKSIIDLAEEDGICIIVSPYSMYRASGELYKAGLKPVF